MRMIRLLFAVLVFAALPLRAERAPVTVFAAASLRGALDAAALGYDGTLQLSYGGSGTMARQIAAGAPADVVLLASVAWMDWLEGNRGIIPGSRVDLLANRLVLIAPASQKTQPEYSPDSVQVISMLGPEGRLAMGQRDAVPAGIYAREWLQQTGQWDSVESRLAETDNVRAALALVARGQAPLGIVYASDALAESAVRIVHQIPEASHTAIRYPAAALTSAGQGFLDYLSTPQAQALFVAHGFGRVPK